MKKLLSLTLVLMLLFTTISFTSVSAAAVTNGTVDAEGFQTVYLYGYESGAKAPTGGDSNFWTNAATPVAEGKKTLTNGLESVTTYADAAIDKPVAYDGEAFGDKVLKFDYTYGGNQTVTTCIARIGNIKNQVTFESGATYRASFWIRIDETSLNKDYAILNSPYLCIGGTTNASATIATAQMGNRIIKRGEWTKVGMTFTANDTFASKANSEGWGIRWNMNSTAYGTDIIGYLDNFKLEKLTTRTRTVEANYVHFEGFDNTQAGAAISNHPYYNKYFTPSYPKPADANPVPTWTTRKIATPFGGSGVSFSVVSTAGFTYSGGASLKNTFTSYITSGGNYIADIFNGDFTTADIGRRFKISAMVYPVSSTAETAPADGGVDPTFYIALGGADGVGSGNYGCEYRGFTVAGVQKTMKWDTWNEISTIFTVTDAHVLQTSVTDSQVKSANAYKAVNAVRINQSGSKNLTKEFYTDNYLIRELKKYTISAASSDDAMGTVEGAGECWEDKSITLTATPNEGYLFSGWYNGETLVSSDASFVISNPTGNASYVAKFVKDAKAEYTNEVYYHNFETDEGFTSSAWVKVVNGTSNVSDGNKTVSWDSVASKGITMPEGGVEQFGKQLYHTDYTSKNITSELAGRFKDWEKKAADSKYVEGKPYTLTMWVYPVSYQNANGHTTTSLTLSHEDSGSLKAGITKTFSGIRVGQWNKITWDFIANDMMAESVIPGIYFKFPGTLEKDQEVYTCINEAYYDNIRVTETTEWEFGDTAEPSGWVARGADKGLDTAFHGSTVYNKSIRHVETYDKVGVVKPSTTCGDHVFVYDVTRPNVVEKDYNPKQGSVFWPEDGEKMSYEDALAIYSSYETLTGDFAGRFNNIVPANTLSDGSSYKISLKVYIAEKRNISAEGCPVVTDNTNVTIIGTHTGSDPVGDGKRVTKSVPYGQWTEVSYIFKATEKGHDIAPSLRVNFGHSLTSFPTLVYVDDVKVELTHVDDLALEISQDGTYVTATATVNDIKSGNSLKAIVIIAAYDADGKLIDVALSSENGENVAVDGTISATYTKADDVDKYVAFLWDDLANIRFYVLPVTLDE